MPRKTRTEFTFLPPIHGDQDLNTLMARIIDMIELDDEEEENEEEKGKDE